ncbi:uncharacterized protein LOC117105629 [Anneissia japonica]|uniref:uncharacterized protein LOC117105629 n=1 Tax=Anneissia japonica TaxID=1529436 RepID=UPI0014257505|nr:uncharacterized protein LOC117105629 [Anneissia japonica]
MIFFQVAILVLIILQTTDSQTCSTRTSNLSGTGDDDYIQVKCVADEVMTSCMSFGEEDYDAGKRDGEKILLDSGSVVCRAFNGNGGKGVRAYARCCTWLNMECSYPSTLSSINDLETYFVNSVTCPDDNIVVGCMAYSRFSCIRGASPGISAITASSINSKADQELNSNVCRAYSCRSVSPSAACCRAPGLECHVRTSSMSTLAAVNCNPGWFMTGCNVHTSNESSNEPSGTRIVNNVCNAYGTGDEVWAVAVCCRTVEQVTDSPPITIDEKHTTVETVTRRPTPSSVPNSTSKSQCQSLNTPGDAVIVGDSMTAYYSGDTIEYQCLDGFERNLGDNRRVCELDGQWSGTDLQCTKSGVYVPQYALYIAGGALFLLVICLICVIFYKRKHLKEEKPEENYKSSASSVRSDQSLVFHSPIYEELPQFALVKSKTLPARPPALPHRCPSCSEENSLKRHNTTTRPRSMPVDLKKKGSFYVKYRGKPYNLYDLPPIEAHFDTNYELPKSDPPPPPLPPGEKRPTHFVRNQVEKERPISSESVELQSPVGELSSTSTATENGMAGIANPAFKVEDFEFMNGILSSTMNTQVSEL